MRKGRKDKAMKRRYNEQKLRLLFQASSSLNTAALHDIVKHIARVAAENDYEALLNSGKIPYTDPKHRG